MFSDLWLIFCDTLTENRPFLCQGVTQELEILYARTAAGEVRQASCSKRLRKLRPRACSTFLCLPLANFPTYFSFDLVSVHGMGDLVDGWM